MGRRLILDTTALITIERDPSATPLDDDDLAVAALTVAEYRVGIELAETARPTCAEPGSHAAHTT